MAAAHSPETVEEIRRFWENSDFTSAEIGAHFGISKNTVIGLANARRWASRKPPPQSAAPTMIERLDALEAKFNAVVAACNATLEGDRARYRRERARWLAEHKNEQHRNHRYG